MDKQIEELIEIGRQIKEAETLKQKELEKIEIVKLMNAWQNCQQEVLTYLEEFLRPYLNWPEDVIAELRPVPKSAFDLKWPLNIPGLAPILVKMNRREVGLGPYAEYSVPRIEFFDEPEEFRFNWSSRGYGGYKGSLCLETFSLERALFDAFEKFNQLETLNQEYKHQKSLIQPKTVEPIYENLDGSEPLPDLVLVENLRRMIREEIKQSVG